jgi:molybdate transport system substrate-binding protein
MSAPLRVVSSMATRALLAALASGWQRAGSTPVEVESVGGVVAARRIAAGEPFDVAVLAADALDRLAAGGHVVAASRVEVARSPVAIAVPRGAPRPAVGDAEALRRTLLATGRIALSTGPSGTALAALFARWGLDAALASRLVQAPPGVPVGDLLARGEADLGFQQWSELMDVPGVDILGPMPPGLGIVTTFAGCRCTAGVQPELADELLAFLADPARDEIKRRHGMAPGHA